MPSFLRLPAAWAAPLPRLRALRLARAPVHAPTALVTRRRLAVFAATAPSATGVARNADPDAVAVISGASRGIGLAATQAIFGRFRGRVIALCRSPDDAGALQALFQFNPHRFRILPCDIADEKSVAAAAAAVREFGGQRVDLVFNCAGLLHADGHMPETSLAKVDPAFLRRNFEVNAIGPILLAKHLSPLMVTVRKEGRVPSVFASITSRVGRISDNGLGGWISYRSSKAAQNQALKTASIELGRRGVIVVALHPGTVDTDLSMPFQKNVSKGKLFLVDIAAKQLLDAIDSLEQSDNGSFLAYNRSRILW